MKTAFTLSFLLLAAVAGPAAAQDIRVSISGKSPAVLREDISRAAAAVCATAVREGDVDFFELNDCVRVVSDDSLQQAKAIAAAKPA